MQSNLELFLLAFLHGSFIATLLLLVVSLACITLFLSFSIGLFFVVVVDLLNVYPVISRYYEETKANLELGLVLIVCVLTNRVVGVSLVLKPFFEHLGSVFKVNARRLRDYIDALKLA
ncbi:hypothetical protein TIFTF001_009180 [Ficus carica]|uniref:Uncharacterized protein n=1 Tax=Ficus carica TaxID=3494 RepID=A0AA87ZUU6_FICCA|nr:hypothetical protein TIFTF001_009180 [Ficus carica]